MLLCHPVESPSLGRFKEKTMLATSVVLLAVNQQDIERYPPMPSSIGGLDGTDRRGASYLRISTLDGVPSERFAV